jgi:UDP-N-acetylmuramate--alanine ligase
MRLAQSRVHFIGIGGIGMCGLAELLHNMGVYVQGSDMSENANSLRLKELGVSVYIGHAAHQIENTDVCVYSSAVKKHNVEYAAARRKGIPLIPRAEALAEIMRLKRGIGIAGSHGKTTTTSMTAAILLACETDPTIVVGGRLDLIKSTAKLGSGEWIVAEADESDGSFNRLSPEIVVITNIDNDHLDHYKTFENLQTAFYEFATRIPFYGLAIVCGDDPHTRQLFQDFPKRILMYGFEESNDFILRGENSNYEIYFSEVGKLDAVKWGEFKLAVPGRHNALNALAAILAARETGLHKEDTFLGLQTFNGVDRRLQKRLDENGYLFYDDYGHHPTEIRAVLQALREKVSDRKIKVLFQPHRYSRTQLCWNDFKTCFDLADEVYLLDIYPAGEAPIAGVTTEKLVSEMAHKGVSYVKSKPEAVSKIAASLKPQDVFLTLGAGDVYKSGDEIFRTVMGLKS